MSTTKFSGNSLYREAIDANGDLKSIAFNASSFIWEGWKKGKQDALDNPGAPFQGGPEALIKRGITSYTQPDGVKVDITPMTRIRMRQLSDDSLKQIGILELKGKVDDGADVVHPEFTNTFEESVAKSDNHLMNNFVGAAATIDCLDSFIFGSKTTIDEAISTIKGILNGGSIGGVSIVTLASRASWIGRVCLDGSWDKSADFKFHRILTNDAMKLDEYVAKPVLTYFVNFLKSVRK